MTLKWETRPPRSETTECVDCGRKLDPCSPYRWCPQCRTAFGVYLKRYAARLRLAQTAADGHPSERYLPAGDALNVRRHARYDPPEDDPWYDPATDEEPRT